jgi:hypothetical protein
VFLPDFLLHPPQDLGLFRNCMSAILLSSSMPQRQLSRGHFLSKSGNASGKQFRMIVGTPRHYTYDVIFGFFVYTKSSADIEPRGRMIVLLSPDKSQTNAFPSPYLTLQERGKP